MDQDLLQTIAEVAVTLAGFSWIIPVGALLLATANLLAALGPFAEITRHLCV